MKTIHYISFFAAAILCISCNDSFLECGSQDQLTDMNFWQTEAHLASVANTFTSSLSGKDWLNKTEAMAESAPWAASTAYRTIGGGNFSTDIDQINSFWTVAYKGIGRTNYFLANYNRAVGVSKEIRERYAAEAYFYRAYNYWLLTSYFGDVPYITDELDVDHPDVYRGRDKREDVIKNITKDLEDHLSALPEYIQAASAEFGRISQTTAYALLSRIYLHNGMWQESVTAAENAMKSSYYKLYNTGKPDEDYVDLFNYKGRASRNAANCETLLAFVYNYDLGESARTSHNLSRECWVPNDYARFVPTQSQVNCYLTDEGKIWDPSSVSTYEEIFEHRDPRLKQSILAPGTSWTGGASGDKLNTDPGIFTYPKFDNSKEGCMTYTGYYMRKYVEPSTVQYVGHDDNDIVLIRYAEVLLNYAEAKMELGTLTQTDLDKSVNLLRDRVGMVHLKLDKLPAGSDIRMEIYRERRVELFFEGHRYFDLKRWKQGALLGQDLLGTKREWMDESRLTANLDNMNWKTLEDGGHYVILETGRRFDDPKHYLFPVPFKQMQLNPNLAPNNTGW
ncbi:MAG: RagB/SusD family nutrient uptake outer membrane protein [Candidatus Cryptobacteroides sp.]